MSKIYKQSENIVKEIDKRAVVFANDNLFNPSEWDIMFVKNAMLIGSAITLDSELTLEKERNEVVKHGV